MQVDSDATDLEEEMQDGERPSHVSNLQSSRRLTFPGSWLTSPTSAHPVRHESPRPLPSPPFPQPKRCSPPRRRNTEMRQHLSALLLATYPAGTPITAVAQDMQAINETGMISTPDKPRVAIPRTPKADVEQELVKFCLSFAQSVEPFVNAASTPRPPKRILSGRRKNRENDTNVSSTLGSDERICPCLSPDLTARY